MHYLIFSGNIDNLYRRVVHLYVATSELSGRNVEYSGFKRGIMPMYFVKKMSSDLSILNKERHKREKDTSLQ